MSFAQFPKLNLISYPTPFQELANLRAHLGVRQRIFIKRDDLTEIGLGGNKNRKLDYVLADVDARQADVIVTSGGQQSNHCRQTLAYARRLGLDCHLVLEGIEPQRYQGNLLLFDLLDATLHFEPDGDRLAQRAEEVAEKLRQADRRPFVVPIGASTPLGVLGYIDSFEEILEQGHRAGIDVGHVFVATGSAGTQAGLEIGTRLHGEDVRIHGVAISRPARPQAERVAALANLTTAFIGHPGLHVRANAVQIHDAYYGAGYAIPTSAGNEAIRLIGRTEGILLDPVYTGKAMSGLIDILQRGQLEDDRDIVFIHTGGFPAIFNFAESLQHNRRGYERTPSAPTA